MLLAFEIEWIDLTSNLSVKKLSETTHRVFTVFLFAIELNEHFKATVFYMTISRQQIKMS